MSRKNRPDVYQEVTASVLNMLRDGISDADYQTPWTTAAANALPVNKTTGKHYNGINILVLWVSAFRRGYEAGQWATFKQWAEIGGQVRKGEKATGIVYVGTYQPDQDDGSDTEDEDSARRYLKRYAVFNIDQVDGIARPDIERPALATRIETAETYIQATGATVHRAGGQAFYNRRTDAVTVPDLDRFTDTRTATATENAYSTILHELTHWTAHQTRLDRPNSRYGTPEYAFEELIAELGAAFLCAALGITPQTREDHGQYLASWLKLLSEDKRAIFRAAAAASRAVDYLDGLQPKETTAAA